MVEHSSADSEMQQILICAVDSDRAVVEQDEALEKPKSAFLDAGSSSRHSKKDVWKCCDACSESGVLVKSAMPGSPAEVAGLIRADVGTGKTSGSLKR